MTAPPTDFPNPCDAKLIESSREGNQDAYGQLVQRYQSLVCSLAYSRCGDLALSEDLAQEAFLVAWEKLAELRGADSFKSWVCTIVRNLAGRAAKKKARHVARTAGRLDAVEDVAADSRLPEAPAISAEEAKLVWETLERIPETYREPLILFYREEQSIARVAESLELSEDAVKQRLSRGRRMLRQHLVATVETTLSHSKPSTAFTAAVLAGLSGLMSKTATAAGVSATTATIAKTSAASLTKSGAGALAGAGLGAIFLTFLVKLPVIRWMYRTIDSDIRSNQERQLYQQFYLWQAIGILLFVVALVSSFWWGKYIEVDWIRNYLPVELQILFYIPLIFFSRRFGKRVEQLRMEEGTFTPPRPLVNSSDHLGMAAMTYRIFWVSGILIIAWPAVLAVRASDWLALAGMVAIASGISLIAAWVGLKLPAKTFLVYRLSTVAVAFIGIAIMMWKRLLWTPGANDFAWFFVAMSGMVTTLAVLGMLVWKRIYGKDDREIEEQKTG